MFSPLRSAVSPTSLQTFVGFLQNPIPDRSRIRQSASRCPSHDSKRGIFFFITSGVVFPFRSIIFSICKSRSTQDAKNNRWLTAIVVKALWLVYFSQRAGFPTCVMSTLVSRAVFDKQYRMRRIWRKPSKLKYQTRFLKMWFFLWIRGFVYFFSGDLNLQRINHNQSPFLFIFKYGKKKNKTGI